jgi:hypothetical protein
MRNVDAGFSRRIDQRECLHGLPPLLRANDLVVIDAK